MSPLLNQYCKHLQLAEVLIEHGAEVNTFDKTSKATPLHRAASRYSFTTGFQSLSCIYISGVRTSQSIK